jgi:hypothetical protein
MSEKSRFEATFRTAALWMTLLVVVFLAWHSAQIQKKDTSVKFSEFMAQVESGYVADVTITGNEIKGHFTSQQSFKSFAPIGYDKLVDTLLAKKVTVNYQPDQTPIWANMLISWGPFILLIGPWVFWARHMQWGRSNRSADDFARLLAQLAELEQLLGEARRIGTQTVVSLIVTPGGRAEGDSARLVVPAAVDVVRLQLDVVRGSAYRSHRTHRALIRTPEGHQVWAQDGLRREATDAGVGLMVEIPAKVLSTGEYTLMLSGFTHDGDIKDLAEYSFGIVTR